MTEEEQIAEALRISLAGEESTSGGMDTTPDPVGFPVSGTPLSKPPVCP